MGTRFQQYAILIVTMTLLASGLLCAGPAYDKWSTRTPTAKPTVKDYDRLIADMDKGRAELKKERDALTDENDKTTYVSLWALREAQKRAEAKDAADNGGFSFSIGWPCLYISESDWHEWFNKAIMIDRTENLTTWTTSISIKEDKE